MPFPGYQPPCWLELKRVTAGEKGVIGELDGFIQRNPDPAAPLLNKPLCCTVERPWVDNQPRVSCIPDGTYPLLYKRDGKFRTRYKDQHGFDFVLEIGRVNGRSYILIHKANDPMKDLLGCAGTCQSATVRKSGQVWGSASSVAYQNLMKWCMANRPSHIEVKGLTELLKS